MSPTEETVKEPNKKAEKDNLKGQQQNKEESKDRYLKSEANIIRIKLAPVKEVFMPFSNGQYINGFVYNILPEIHHQTPKQKFAVSSILLPKKDRQRVKKYGVKLLPTDQPYMTIRFFTSEIAEKFKKRLVEQYTLTNQPIKLGEGDFKITSTDSRKINYKELVTTAQPHTLYSLKFLSPTALGSRTENVTISSPTIEFSRILQSIINKWNNIVGVQIPESLLTWTEKYVHITNIPAGGRNGIKTAVLRYFDSKTKNISYLIGLKGTVKYEAFNDNKQHKQMICALLKFAEITGIGTGVTWGAGNVRVQFSSKE